MPHDPAGSDEVSRAFDTGKPLIALLNREVVSSRFPPGILEEVLTAGELSFLKRPLHRNTRSRYTTGRAVLRILVTHLAKTPPRDALFADGLTGAPLDLKCADGAGLCFSVSHSGSYTLLGFCKGGRLGVDIERKRTLKQVRELATYVFSEEESRWLTTMEPALLETAFFRIWTRKEAVVKYYRGSVAADMHRFTVPLDISCGVHSVSPGLSDTTESLWLIDHVFNDDTFAAWCQQGPGADFSLYEIDAELINDCLRRYRELSRKAT